MKLYAIIIVLCISIYIWKKIKNWCDENLVKAAREDILHYIKTGEKTKFFLSLGNPLIETAESWRYDYLNSNRRRKENAAIDYGFCLICECPGCGDVNLHHMTGNMAGRECRKCGLTWHIPA